MSGLGSITLPTDIIEHLAVSTELLITWRNTLNSCPYLELDIAPLTDQQVWETNKILRRDHGLKLVKHWGGIRLVGVDPT